MVFRQSLADLRITVKRKRCEANKLDRMQAHLVPTAVNLWWSKRFPRECQCDDKLPYLKGRTEGQGRWGRAAALLSLSHSVPLKEMEPKPTKTIQGDRESNPNTSGRGKGGHTGKWWAVVWSSGQKAQLRLQFIAADTFPNHSHEPQVLSYFFLYDNDCFCPQCGSIIWHSTAPLT